MKNKKFIINEKGKVFDPESQEFRVLMPSHRDYFYQKGKYVKAGLSIKSFSALLKEARKFGKDIVIEMPRIKGRPIIFVTEGKGGKLKVAITPMKKQAAFNWPKHKN